MRKWLFFSLKAAITIGLMWWILRHVDYAVLRRDLRTASPGLLLLTVLLLASTIGLSARRWQLVLKAGGRAARFGPLMAFTLIGYFFNQALPSTVGGDGIRAFLVYQDGTPGPLAIRSVLIERGLGLIVLAILAALGLPHLMAARGIEVLPSWALEGLLLIGIAAGLGALWFLERGSWLQRLPLGTVLHKLIADILAVIRQPRIAGEFVLLSLAGQLLGCVVIFLIARSIHAPLSLMGAISVAPTVFLFAAIPISIAGWGVREGVMVVGLGIFGIPPSEALMVSVLFGLANLTVGMLGGLAWLMRDHALREKAEAGLEEINEPPRARSSSG